MGKNRRQLQSCSQKCWPILLRQLSDAKYKLLIILGVETLRIFNLLAKTDLQIGKLDEATVGKDKYFIIALFHPSPINPTGMMKNKAIWEEEVPKIRTSLAF